MPRILSRRSALTALVSLLAFSLSGIGAAAAAPGTISFTSASYSVDEGAGSASITLSRSGGTDGAATAKVTPSDGTAGGGDYRFTPGAIDSTFNFNGSGPDNAVSVVAVQPDGKIFGYLRRGPNESPDTNFDGYNFWLSKLNEFGGDYINAEMVKAFITSDEYRQRFGQ